MKPIKQKVISHQNEFYPISYFRGISNNNAVFLKDFNDKR